LAALGRAANPPTLPALSWRPALALILDSALHQAESVAGDSGVT
jgi:hypothetical protein